MTAPLFADTNLLVYSRDARDAAKLERAREWVDFLWDTRRGRLSAHVGRAAIPGRFPGAGVDYPGRTR